MADQQQKQEEPGPSATPRPRRRPLPMPPDDMIRSSIARCLTQVMVNMQNAETQRKCRELLQVEDLAQGAHIRILAALEQVDARREQHERAAEERKQRRANTQNRKFN